MKKEINTYFILLLKYKIDKLFKNEITNEKGIEKGEFNQCFYCREQANIFCDRINFLLCSHNCENKISELESFVQIIRNIEQVEIINDYLNMIQ